MAKEYTMAEVAGHNTSNDCWIVLNGKVYNVTDFLDDHPGGDKLLLNVTGRDAVEDFEDVGHSHEAWLLTEKYYIGNIEQSSGGNSRKQVSLQPQASDYRKKRIKYAMYAIQFLLPLILLNAAVIFFSRSSS